MSISLTIQAAKSARRGCPCKSERNPHVRMIVSFENIQKMETVLSRKLRCLLQDHGGLSLQHAAVEAKGHTVCGPRSSCVHTVPYCGNDLNTAEDSTRDRRSAIKYA